MSINKCITVYCRSIISICLILLYSCSHAQSTSKKISLEEQQCIEGFAEMEMYDHVRQMGAFWRNDSLGSNGFRKYFTSFYLLTSKVYKDVDYNLVLTNFGHDNSLINDDKKFLYLSYTIFNTKNMGPEFKEFNIQENVFFKFDAKSKKLISVYK